MLVISLVSLLFISGSCEIPLPNFTDNELVSCVQGIILKYYKDLKQMVYVNLNPDADFLLRTIHNLDITSFFSKTPAPTKLSNASSGVAPHQAYIIVSEDKEELARSLIHLIREPNWNPYARFLIVIKTFQRFELRPTFDIFLMAHVNHVVIANGTATAELYTYNPYDNYACGKYYTKITEFGKCLSVTANIYPAKILTGLRNCFFHVSVAHWPPFGIDPSKAEKGIKKLGTEQYVFHLISEIEHFKYKFFFDYDPEAFSFVTNNMSISGPMVMLQDNLTDVMLGGLILIPSRANMFSYLFGHLDQVDEIRVMVKKANEIPAWRNFYLEFKPLVWALLLLSLSCYWILMMMLLKKTDKGVVIMTLLDNLLAHGTSLKGRQSVKLVFIVWVWSTYLVNSFYLTSLMSLTTKPVLDYQISDEATMMAQGLKPCLSDVMNKYRRAESNHGDILKDIEQYIDVKGCTKFLESIRSVGESDRLFTIALYSVYFYNRQKFCDQYGRSPVYSFSKPYTKVIYAMYFQKGFPMYERLHSLAMRIRETGLSDKSLNDHMYGQKIGYYYHSKGYSSRFAIPWCVFIVGLFLSTITFVVELSSRSRATHIVPEN